MDEPLQFTRFKRKARFLKQRKENLQLAAKMSQTENPNSAPSIITISFEWFYLNMRFTCKWNFSFKLEL